jgi:transposase-like protein
MTEDKPDSQKRRYLTPEQKIAILKAHLVDKKTVSDLCDEHGIQPSQFYRWQQEFFERGKLVFENHTEKPSTALERKVTALEEKLARKNDVLAELMEEHVALKKSLGES